MKKQKTVIVKCIRKPASIQKFQYKLYYNSFDSERGHICRVGVNMVKMSKVKEIDFQIYIKKANMKIYL